MPPKTGTETYAAPVASNRTPGVRKTIATGYFARNQGGDGQGFGWIVINTIAVAENHASHAAASKTSIWG